MEMAEELGEEALLYADDILNGCMEKRNRHQHHHKERHGSQEEEGEKYEVTEGQRACMEEMSKKDWAFRMILETHNEAKKLFQGWLEEGSERHLKKQALFAAAEKRVVHSVESSVVTSSSSHHELTAAEHLDAEIHQSLLSWHKYHLSAPVEDDGDQTKDLSVESKKSEPSPPSIAYSVEIDQEELTLFFKQLCVNVRAAFVFSDRWEELMEVLRVSRGGPAPQKKVKKKGKQMDSHGRSQVNSDRYIDTDIMVPGSVQRLRIEVVEPKLIELVKYSENNMFRDIGEIAVATQYVHQLAAPHLQVIIPLSLELHKA